MISTPFLTDIDSRAAVKGSRDPLSVQPIWTAMGRAIIGNLTVASASLKDFKTTLLGYYFVELVQEVEPEASPVAVFLKWEQVANYARAFVNKDRQFRGKERVGQWLEDGATVSVSAEQAHQILSSQRMYGLWGLYSEPSRASGLLQGDSPRLEPDAVDFVRKAYLGDGPLTAGIVGAIVTLLRRKLTRLELMGKDSRLIRAVASVYSRRLLRLEREFLGEHLVWGGSRIRPEVRRRQVALAECLLQLPQSGDMQLTAAVHRSLIRVAGKLGESGAELVDRLEKIARTESILAPTARLFNFLLNQDGRTVEAAAGDIRVQWGEGAPWIDVPGILELEGELAEAVGDREAARRWGRIAGAMASGRHVDLIRLLIEQNTFVMGTRGSAPWIRLEQDRLAVHYREEAGVLPSPKRLTELWRFPYFITSLWQIAAEARAAG